MGMDKGLIMRTKCFLTLLYGYCIASCWGSVCFHTCIYSWLYIAVHAIANSLSLPPSLSFTCMSILLGFDILKILAIKFQCANKGYAAGPVPSTDEITCFLKVWKFIYITLH